ncbi:hypothetical protein GGTG_11501 [Gaeumannomyces tritici R3-111a-1]|uniref:EGF-like domain-containing protein n=1 Tax=Gaeumannomyces tritici (strain R3-111a-1) TaxID=644352 RepID=J3PDD3_GAET3|nr:hypothetical protein GGTG_11501 [Gaeumannomyces tritici R3-111a-1]EJT70478.1 hypothetical protein GGTG_11501 [Gaeumannomyces tritici R3-111a-1]
MSYPQDGRDMEPQSIPGGSVRRARELAMAGLASRTPSDSRMPIRVPQGGLGPNPQLPLPIVRPSPAPVAEAITTSPPRVGIPRPRGDGPITGDDISRPTQIPATQIPQWPLGGPPIVPSASAANQGFAPYQPPPGRSYPPQRPPRPSRVPSMLDGSQLQDPTPVFQYQSQSNRESEVSLQQSATSSTSRPSTVDSVGSIPDFPLPITATPVAPPRRSVNLGPPPSARRGASSFYSNASFVSPIPEESPRSRSRASYASSAAIPRDRDSWDSPISPGPSPTYPESRFEDAIPEEGRDGMYGGDDQGEESQLVRSASIGKRGKALLVSTPAPQRSSEVPEMGMRAVPSPRNPGPFTDGTGYVDASSTSSGSDPRSRGLRPPPAMAVAGAAGAAGSALTAESILSAYDAASSPDPSNPNRGLPVSPQPMREYSHFSAIRRPPKLDIDAVKAAESRGSLTSLPDLIRRATRLAASLEKGRRPASRFLDDMDQYPGQSEKNRASDYEKHQSGLSDMLAAFPPPAQPVHQARRSWRQSVRDEINSWPLPARFSGAGRSRDNSPRDEPPALPTYNIAGTGNNGNGVNNASNSRGEQKQGRRCCGLPLWGFIILVIVLLIIVTAAVVIPVEFFVIRRGNTGAGNAQPALTECQNMLTCANGGTNVVTAQGACSCICTGGFTGATCTVPGANGCTTTNIVDQSPNVGSNIINNVTLGDALPRLIQTAVQNFSIPLSVTQILAKFNSGSLSCLAENALVTFNGDSGSGLSQATVPGTTNNAAKGPQPELPKVPAGVAVEVVTVVVKRQAGQGFSTTLSGSVSFGTTLTAIPPTTTTTVTTTISRRTSSSSSSSSSSRSTSTPSTRSPPPSTSTTQRNPPPASTSFPVTGQVLDFARISVLFVLQQQTLQNAETAQIALQRFFTAAGQGSAAPSPVTPAQARNLTLGNGNSVNLVDFAVDVGAGPVGGAVAPQRALLVRDSEPLPKSSYEGGKAQRPPPLLRMFRR